MPPSIRTVMYAMLLAACPAVAVAAASGAVYRIDPMHTYPSFEADHMGISRWRGKFDHSSGRVVLDRQQRTGTVRVVVDASSIDFGLPALAKWARGKDFLDVDRYPDAVYEGRLAGFADGAPTRVEGHLTLHGITRPLAMKINSFKCIPHPIYKRELCGADVSARFRRDAFGLDAGKSYGFDMAVTLRIQVEALREH